MNTPRIEQGLIIPYEKLSSDALRGLIEEVVTRDGTDNGYDQATLAQNVDKVMEQLRRKEAVIVYDQCTQTANIVTVRHLRLSPSDQVKSSP
ncbi:YheU family protein [Desulfosarcina sp.]|uniref:YheU family protein n=1 Tax=Desulfosarcina sp. TaxID=2027861 RepID=UPI0039710B48